MRLWVLLVSGSFSAWSDNDTAELQGLVADLSPDTATITRVTLTPDGQGGATEATVTVATVACKVKEIGDRPIERQIAERLQGEVLVTITVPTGTDVTNADRITVGSATYEVVGVPPPRSFEARRRVICRAIT